MADKLRIYVDDVTGKQLASAADATNGGAVILVGDDADRWLAANPGLALAKAAAPAANKAKASGENKSQKGA